MKIAGLIIYILITGYITVFVGQTLYKNGRHFLLQMLVHGDLTDAVNRILLTGYYLVNLGYVVIMLTMQPPVQTPSDLINSLSISIGRIMLTLGVMHYCNIAAAVIWNRFSKTKL